MKPKPIVLLKVIALLLMLGSAQVVSGGLISFAESVSTACSTQGDECDPDDDSDDDET